MLVAGLCFTVQAASSSWNVDADSQWTNTLSWTAGVPGQGGAPYTNLDVATFSTTLTASRLVTWDGARSIGGITFGNTSTFGYVLTNGLANNGSLKLSDGGIIQSLAGMGGTNRIYQTTTLTGNGTFLANATPAQGALVLAPVAGVVGKALTLDGTSTATNSVSSLSGTGFSIVKNGTGYWQLNGSANSFSGGLTLNQGVLALVGGGLGGGTVTINGGTLTSVSSSPRTWTNFFVVNNNFALGNWDTGGTGILTLSGGMDLGGGTRILTMSNRAAASSPDTAGNIISGIISNGALTKAGPSYLVLSNANTYAGGTIVSTGTLTAAASGALGAGDITVAGGAKLTLTNSMSSDFINDAAKLTLGTNSTLNLIFTGADNIGGLSLDSGATWLAGGTYTAAALTAAGGRGTYTGAGSLTVPATRTLGLYIIQ